MLTNKKIAITIPAHNEDETIEFVAKNALESVKKITSRYELLLIDDGSTDKTGAIIDRLKASNPSKIRVIHNLKNKGFTGVMKSCYNNAQGDLIFLGPADGQFDYQELSLFAKAITDNDLVVAYRVMNEETFQRKFYSFFFHLLSKILFDIKLREFSTCIMYRKKVRDSISINSNDYSCLFLPEFIYKATKKGFKIGQVPIHFYKRKGGMQKGTNLRMILRTLMEMIKFYLEIKL